MSRTIIGLNSNVIHRITAVLNENLEARNAEYQISQYILNNIDKVSAMGIEELADNAYTSASTISRFIKRLGYKNYLQFKRELIGYQEFCENEFHFTGKTNQELIDELLDANVSSLKGLKNSINYEQIATIAQMMHEAKEIYIFGIDYSQIVAQDFQLRFMNNKKVISTYVANNDIDSVAKNISDDALVIFISVSGNSSCLKAIQFNLKASVKQVLITENITSDLANSADEVIELPKRLDKLVATALSERLNILSILDSIYLVYANTYQE